MFATAQFMTGLSGNGAERAETRVERSGAVSESQKNWAERSVSEGAAERERSVERRLE